MNETVILGTDVKFAVTLTASGFDMVEDSWVIALRRNRKTIKEYTKEDLIEDGEGNWLMPIERELLTTGNYDIVATAEVIDNDFPSGIRHEVARQQLMRVEAV